MDKIGVFCSAAADLPASYTQAAKDLGTWIGQNHKTLVYGGTWKGLMGVIGMACKEAGGQLYGIYPHYMEGKRRNWMCASLLPDWLTGRTCSS